MSDPLEAGAAAAANDARISTDPAVHGAAVAASGPIDLVASAKAKVARQREHLAGAEAALKAARKAKADPAEIAALESKVARQRDHLAAAREAVEAAG
jgi:hypothetical protein